VRSPLRWGPGVELSLDTSHSTSVPSIVRLHSAFISISISVSLKAASFRQICLVVTDEKVIPDIPRELDFPNDSFADSVCYAHHHLTKSTSQWPAQLDAALLVQRKHLLEPL
jgi:hypothetical protein